MALTEYFTPTHVYFGKGAELEAGRLLKERGLTRILLHFGSGSVKRSGLLERVEKNLTESSIEFIELGGVVPNPRLSLVREGIRLCKENKLDAVLAVGGGSVIDSAKAIGYGVFNDGDVWDFYIKKRAPKGCMPVATILTLSATGSEMSDSSVITNEDGNLKRGCNTDYSRPIFSLMNPELTYSVSPYQTGSGTADIMMHTLERFFHQGYTLPITDDLSAALLRNVMDNGLKALKNPEDYTARASLMWAGSLSHNGLMNTGNDIRGDWACHQMEHELSGMFDVAHGAGLAAIWGSWAHYVMDADYERFISLGEKVFGIAPSGNDIADSIAAIEHMEEYFRSINMPTSLKELGINPSEEEISELAEKCSFSGTRTVGSIKALDKEDMKAIYKMAR